jgi:hypothetical protein
MITCYFYLDETKVRNGQEFYVVIKSIAENICLADRKAKKYAGIIDRKLAGGYFVSTCKPYNFKTNYIILTLPKNFKADKYQPDIIDRLIAFENGDVNRAEANAFIAEAKNAGILQAVSKH